MAKKFRSSIEQSTLVACFVRWRAVLSTRTQLEHMKKSIKVRLDYVCVVVDAQ